jgi:hypothetical protein
MKGRAELGTAALKLQDLVTSQIGTRFGYTGLAKNLIDFNIDLRYKCPNGALAKDTSYFGPTTRNDRAMHMRLRR